LCAKEKEKVKKRKLNSTNPKYQPVADKKIVNERKELIASIPRGKRNINVYAVFSEIE
jgi:hypothetical protein|tara:strand:- start:1115 stop:1288 length:174 start_codon:yes stop_codon:yes gene_type:complete